MTLFERFRWYLWPVMAYKMSPEFPTASLDITLWFCCQVARLPEDRFSGHTLLVTITCLLFCLWTDPLWSCCYSLEKFNCRGWCVEQSAVHKGGRSSPNRASGRIFPMWCGQSAPKHNLCCGEICPPWKFTFHSMWMFFAENKWCISIHQFSIDV